MLFSDPSPFRRRQSFLFFILLVTPAFFIFAETASENPELLSKITTQLSSHYFRSLTPSELQAKSLTELFSSLDQGTHLKSVKPSESDFVRGLKEEKSIAKVQRLQNYAAYIQISFLGRRTTNDFEQLLNQFVREDIRTLILDLRDNSGGSLESGISLIEYFIPAGKLLFTFQGREGIETKYYSKKPAIRSLKIFVLINGQTASTAEMMADALRRYADAQLIGESTYGKRSIQEVFAINPSHILFLTTGHFILPDDSQKKIQPDVRAPSEKAFEQALSEITRKEVRSLHLTKTETGVREGKAVKAAAAPQL